MSKKLIINIVNETSTRIFYTHKLTEHVEYYSVRNL